MNKRLQALAQAYQIKDPEQVVEMLLNMHDGITANPKLNELVSISLDPESDNDAKSKLEMSLGGYNDKLNSQTENYNNSLKDFDGIVLALAQKLYPNATPEMLIENLSKVTAPEGAENFGNVERFMSALGMFDAKDGQEGSVQQAQDDAQDLINEANSNTEQQLQGEQNGIKSLDEIDIMQTKIKPEDDMKNLSGKELITAMAKRASKNIR